jgi:hypothetical protein
MVRDALETQTASADVGTLVMSIKGAKRETPR